MEFDHSFKPNRSGLPAALAARMDVVFYARRAQGLNVQFIREDGALDEFSLSDHARVESFTQSLVRQGKAFAVSN